MAKVVLSANNPNVERIIRNRNVDLMDKASIRRFAKCFFESREWMQFVEKKEYQSPLCVVDNWNKTLAVYPYEYPIVQYKCDVNSIYELDGDPHLNAFLESITVSIVQNGKKLSFYNNRKSTKRVSLGVEVYYTDFCGINHSIFPHDTRQMLLKKANLIVSPEGVIVLYTDDQIIATLAFNNGHYWISGNLIYVSGRTVENIKACQNYCKVTLVDKEGIKYNFKLKFDFDISSYQVLIPKVSEM